MKSVFWKLTLLLPLTMGNALSAEPYRIEISAGIWKSNYSGDGPSSDSDSTRIGFQYLLQAPQQEAVPLAEAAYLAKSDAVSVDHFILDLEGSKETTTGLKSRFVTPTDTIFTLAYVQQDLGNISADSMTVGIGKHITKGHSYTVNLNYADDPDIISLAYVNRLVQDNNGGKWSSLEFTTSIIDIGEGNNLAIGINGDSYLSLHHSIGAGLLYTDLGAGSVIDLNLNSRYFLTDRLFGAVIASYSKLDFGNGDTNSTTFALNLGARF